MRGSSLFLRFYLTLLLVLALPMLLFGAAELLTRQEERHSRQPEGLVKFLEWTLSALANEADSMLEANAMLETNTMLEADSMPKAAFERRLRDVEEGSGLKFYVRWGRRDEGFRSEEFRNEDFSPPLPERLPAGRFVPPPPSSPIVASALSRSGKVEIVAELYPFSSSARRQPFFRELAMLLSALLGAGTSWLLARGFLRPLSELRATTARLAAGDFSARVGEGITRRGDEIGDLSVSFNGMAERLAELLGAQKRLLADVSHEIRSPLQRMEIALALARDAEAGELEDCLDRLETEVGRIDAMVEELLLLTRAESRMAPGDEEILLEGLLAGLVEDVRFEEREERLEIDMDAAGNLTVLGNSVLLERALRNVLHNAVRYASEGRITVRALEKDGRAEISVSDRGKGLPEDELEKIFLPWYRANGSRALPQEGMGLGLSISRRIVESCGGSISAANNPDGGLTVTVLLPLVRR